MKHQFIKVAAITTDIEVGNVACNTEKILDAIAEAHTQGIRLAVFPELCLTGYTCGDLFLQDILLTAALKGLKQIIDASEKKDMVIVAGLPFYHTNALYNVAAVIFDGQLLGIVPKQFIPNYSEFYEARHFATPGNTVEYIDIPELKEKGTGIAFGKNLLFPCSNLPEFILGVEICEDLWVPIPPSCHHALAGATVIANLSASDETTGKDLYRSQLIAGQSARLVSGYIYADAGEGESSTDLVFSGHNFIAENGIVLAESRRFHNGMICSEIDLGRLVSERRRMGTYSEASIQSQTAGNAYSKIPMKSKPLSNTYSTAFAENGNYNSYHMVSFAFHELTETTLTRQYPQTPFVPQNKADRDRRCDEILSLQAMGLKKRLAHTHCSNAVIGISGGLDSTLALLVTARAFDMLGFDRKGILCVTMPCFGTTDRTYHNACELTKTLGATLKEVPIEEGVTLHFRDIGHDGSLQDVTYENSQARYRTLILMNLANQSNGMVIGTGDMSELALGWATYNGDHMSMYGVNCSVPKTLVRYLVQYHAETTPEPKLRDILMDVLETPVSPELLPPKDGEISQKTEDIVGPYELHDFYLYYLMRFGFTPSKIYRLAQEAFAGVYDDGTIYKWLRTFYHRFFTQQFKRSCLPDGPKVGSVALSPRGDWRMPSDASVRLWMEDLENLPHV